MFSAGREEICQLPQRWEPRSPRQWSCCPDGTSSAGRGWAVLGLSGAATSASLGGEGQLQGTLPEGVPLITPHPAETGSMAAPLAWATAQLFIPFPKYTRCNSLPPSVSSWVSRDQCLCLFHLLPCSPLTHCGLLLLHTPGTAGLSTSLSGDHGLNPIWVRVAKAERSLR